MYQNVIKLNLLFCAVFTSVAVVAVSKTMRFEDNEIRVCFLFPLLEHGGKRL